MRDRGRILIGLAIFVVLVTFPFWSRLAASGEAEASQPELEYPADESVCVEETAYMTANHMDLLNDWRDMVVRDGVAAGATIAEVCTIKVAMVLGTMKN